MHKSTFKDLCDFLENQSTYLKNFTANNQQHPKLNMDKTISTSIGVINSICILISLLSVHFGRLIHQLENTALCLPVYPGSEWESSPPLRGNYAENYEIIYSTCVNCRSDNKQSSSIFWRRHMPKYMILWEPFIERSDHRDNKFNSAAKVKSWSATVSLSASS